MWTKFFAFLPVPRGRKTQGYLFSLPKCICLKYVQQVEGESPQGIITTLWLYSLEKWSDSLSKGHCRIMPAMCNLVVQILKETSKQAKRKNDS